MQIDGRDAVGRLYLLAFNLVDFDTVFCIRVNACWRVKKYACLQKCHASRKSLFFGCNVPKGAFGGKYIETDVAD